MRSYLTGLGLVLFGVCAAALAELLALYVTLNGLRLPGRVDPYVHDTYYVVLSPWPSLYGLLGAALLYSLGFGVWQLVRRR